MTNIAVRLSAASAFLLAVAVDVWAQPTVSGGQFNIVDGRRVLIVSGSGFGTRGSFNTTGDGFMNVAWHDYEDGKLVGGGWTINPDPAMVAQWSVLSTGGRTLGNRYGHRTYQTTENGGPTLKQRGTTGYWFISWWFMMPTPQQSGKFFRIYGTPYGTHSDILLSTGGNDVYPKVDFNVRGGSQCPGCNPRSVAQWGSPDKFVGFRWHRVDVLMRDDPVLDEFTVYLDGKLQWTKRSADGYRWVHYPFGGDGHTLHIATDLNAPWRNNNYGSPGAYNVDDLFLDYTWARVELGDAPIWQDCRHKEIQIPRTWSDSSVTVDFNAGSFTPGQMVYAFVVNAAGQVGRGFPVVIPGSTTFERAPRSTGIPKIGF